MEKTMEGITKCDPWKGLGKQSEDFVDKPRREADRKMFFSGNMAPQRMRGCVTSYS